MVGTTGAVDFIRAGLAAYNERDTERAVAVLHPDVELVLLRSLLDGTHYTGHAGYRQFLADMADEWESWSVEPQEFRALEGDRVLVLGNFVGHASASGVDVDIPGAWVVTMRNGLVGQVRAYGDREHALRELGLDG